MTAVDHTTGEILEDTIEIARRQLGTAITELHHEALLADDPADLARALACARDFKADLATVYRDIEDRLIGSWPEQGDLEVPTLGLFGLHRRTKRTGWDHDALVHDVLDAAAGPDRPVADLTGWEAAEALRKAISFGAGKVTALRQLGLQPDEYCREEQDGMTVELPPRDHGKDVA